MSVASGRSIERLLAPLRQAGLQLRRRRFWLWVWLIALVLAVLVTLVWLASRYEASTLQAEVERDAQDAASDVRNALQRHIQAVQGLRALSGDQDAMWQQHAQGLLVQHRDWLRIESRSPDGRLLRSADSPHQSPVFDVRTRANWLGEMEQACQRAARQGTPVFSRSYFLPAPVGRNQEAAGMELIELCVPHFVQGRVLGLDVLTYSLRELLIEQLDGRYGRRNELSFTEPDGTRLALAGSRRRGARLFSAQQLLDLPGGSALVLRLDGRRDAPDLFPNVLTALVTVMSIALLSVLAMLVKDARRRQQAEQELAEALAFRKAMEDSLVTGLRARDLSGRITYVNPAFCQMVGFAPAELIGRNAPMPYWPSEMADEYQRRQAVRLAGHLPPREGFESEFMHKDGTRFPVLIIEAPLISITGEQTGWMSAVLDISEQRRVEDLSRASQERLQATARLATVGEMASLLSHELNQPLAAIASYATGSLNLLQAPGAQPAEPMRSPALQEVQMALERIAAQASRAGQVINSVHDFVRRRDQHRAPVQAQAVLDAIMPLVQLQARKLRVQLDLQIERGLPDVLCDRTMVEQVLLNLARNGMQAMGETPVQARHLQFRVRRAAANAQQAWLEFAVIDSGSGIAPEVAEQLFTPFFTTKREGMGLGLSLCRTVIEQHGGHLGYSPRAGGGTEFVFTLPVVLAEATALQ